METNQNSGRRSFLKNSFLAGAAGLFLPSFMKAGNAAPVFTEVDPYEPFTPATGPFTLPPLPYDVAALEPYIDSQTMQIHHDKHHGAYVSNLNKAVEENHIDAAVSLDDLVKNISKYPAAIRNNGGGHWNHSFFWKIMKAQGGGKPIGKLGDAINSTFGSIENLKTKFNEAGAKRFGSGWAWLYVTKDGKLEIGSTPNQDNPLMDISEIKGTPVLGLDVWEHAYYLKYQYRRPDYMNGWWNLINWEQAEKNFASAK